MTTSGYQASGNHDAYDAKEVSWNWGAGEDFGRLWRICTAPDANTRCLADNKDQSVSGQVLDMRHAYDDGGNLINLRDKVNSDQVQTFTYDHRDRLLTAGTNAVGAGQYNHFYVYNKLGNITSYNGVGYAYSATHKHAVTSVGSATYGYDLNGSMTSRVEGGVTTTQNFNVENELASVVRSGQTTTFTYDAAGIRVKTVLPTGKTVYFPFPGYDEEVNGATTTRRTAVHQ